MTDSAPTTALGIAGILYGVYAWFVFALCIICAILCAVIVPGLGRRRRCVSFLARIPLRLAGIATTITGLENLPAGDCVAVANHASNIDGIVLMGHLPPIFSYVVKGEMQRFPFVAFLLRRVGSRFVERFEISASARDARKLLKAANTGESLVVFPEGTFITTPGLGRFRAGAFAAAISASVPLVPVVISGARYIMPAASFFPRRGRLRIDVLEPVEPSDPAFANSKTLADAARQSILAVLDESDLQTGDDR